MGQRYAITVATAATTEPVALADVKTHLNITSTADDALLKSMIQWAEDKFQRDTGRQLLNATFHQYFDEFPNSDSKPLNLARAPISSESSDVVITYVNTSAGTTSTWSSSLYKIDPYSEPARIAPAYAQTYPTAREEDNAVKVAFVAGYGTSGSNTIPDMAKAAIYAAVAEQHRYREVGAWDDAAEEGWQRAIGLLRYE